MASKVEQAVLNSKTPIASNSTEQLEVNGVKVVVLNKEETANIKNINDYKLNEDRNPQVIKKKLQIP